MIIFERGTSVFKINNKGFNPLKNKSDILTKQFKNTTLWQFTHTKKQTEI